MKRREPIFNQVELQRVFEEQGLDAIVARSGRNVAYLTGMNFPGTLGRLQDFANAPRAALVVWPREGEPTFVVSNIARGLAERLSWIEDIQSYVEYVESPYTLVARSLRERGLGAARIGVERREFGVDNWDAFAFELPSAELIDVTDALEGARNIKTDAEIALLRQAVEIQDEAHLDVFRTARRGDTEKKLHTRMIAAMLRLGAESAHGMMQASSNPVTYGGEGAVPIALGDAVRTDYVCYVQGYPANLSRMAVMGTPSAEQEARYRVLLSVHRSTIDRMLRPGVAANDVFNFVRDRFIDAGFDWSGGLVGHSVGVWWHQEEPMLVPSESRTLKAGMVVCLEPILEGFWHLQDQILITDNDPVILSDRFGIDKLFVMGLG
ncbi:MAG TPA: Xaa-Pro peptidase family protein [Nitrolancea sp.]|nr:Xaa-Pro peptidase family protein [Nitrolancea sp.]